MEPRDHLFKKMLALSVGLHVLTFLLGAVWMIFRVPPVLVAPVAVVDLISGGTLNPPAQDAAPKSPPPAEARGKTAEARQRTTPRPAAKKGKGAARQEARAREASPPDTREFSEKIRKMREERATSTRVREAVETIQREKAIRAAVRGIGDSVAHRVDLSGVRPQQKGAARPPAAGGMPGAAGTVRVPPEILAYARALDEKVRANWTVPELAQKDAGKLIVQVRITIEKNGVVSNVRMEKVSGNPYFDDSVRRAIQKASPLPIPPEQLRGGEDHYDVGFRFYGGNES
jgi:colicin import membrane protein